MMAVNPDYYYQNGYDDGAPSVNTERIHTNAVRKMKCSKCGSRMRYQGFHKTPPYASYVAFAVCTNRNCNYAEEF